MRVLALACEDEGHYRVATRLVDDALRPLFSDLDANRCWQGRTPQERWYKYRPDDAAKLPRRLADGTQVRRHGKLGNEPELRMWRDVLYIFAADANPRPATVVLCRDMDANPERRSGMESARSSASWPFEVVVAGAEPEVEAWIVAGFEPVDDREQSTLDGLRKSLSFDPTTQSQRLTSRPNDAKTDAKRVANALCDHDGGRKMACLADRNVLAHRGAKNGLRAFLAEIDEHIVPLFGAAP